MFELNELRREDCLKHLTLVTTRKKGERTYKRKLHIGTTVEDQDLEDGLGEPLIADTVTANS